MLMVILLLTTFSAQFVLPVQTGSERLAVIRRLFGYVLGERGPITYIREGQAVEAHEESLRTGPGVFLIDSSSAVVLRTDVAFTRACGPGVVFTTPGERRAEALDLRRQIRRVDDGTPPTGSQSESDQTDSIALTQDGIQISADISVTFILDPGHRDAPREGGDPRLPPYEFSRAAAERAVYGHVYSEMEDIPWTRLPLILVIDAWRELVKSRRLEALLTSDEQALNPLDLLRNEIVDRLTIPSDASTNELGTADVSREAELLYSRGIRLLDVRISNLQLPPEIQAERNLQWRERWGGSLTTAKTRAIENLRAEGRLGESMADSVLLAALSKSVREELENDRKPGRRDTLLSIYSDASKLSRQSGIDPEGKILHRLDDCMDSIAALDPNCDPQANEDPV
jgi:regulator of protease activity HflC (stomatin/prohibitin superfamily)